MSIVPQFRLRNQTWNSLKNIFGNSKKVKVKSIENPSGFTYNFFLRKTLNLFILYLYRQYSHAKNDTYSLIKKQYICHRSGGSQVATVITLPLLGKNRKSFMRHLYKVKYKEICENTMDVHEF